MSSTPEPDPYVVLGVQKDAAIAEIKSAYRKLALKYHPDKIKDDSLRDHAVDEFQKVQQAYELLSDDAKRARYDQKVRLAELRRQMMEREAAATSSPGASPRGSANLSTAAAREYRDGRVYEERMPAEPMYFEEEIRFTEEPRSYSRKHDGYARRHRSRGADEKKRSKTDPLGTPRIVKEMLRETTRSAHTDRAKTRTKERRRETSDKYERAAPAADSYDDDDSTELSEPIYVRLKRPSESRKTYESSRRKTTQESTARRSGSRRYDDEEFSDDYETKHDHLHTSARDYILRSKGKPAVEVDGRNRSSRSPQRYRGYESADPEPPFESRRSGRSARSPKETVRPAASRHGSREHLEPQTRSYSYDTKVPSMPTAATSPGVKVTSSPSPRPSLQRSSTSAYARPKPQASSHSDPLLHMVHEEAPAPRSSKLKGMEKPDSGYSSPGTPEMHQGSSPPKLSSTRYRVVEDRETVLIDPEVPSSRHHRSYSPGRAERTSAATRPVPKPISRSTTYAYAPETSARYESTRPPPSRSSSSKPLFAEVEFTIRPKTGSVKYAREIGPDDIIYSNRDVYSRHPHLDDSRQPTPRRQSAYA